MNSTQKALFWGSVKSAVGVITGAILTNIADPAYPIVSGAWWKHLGIAVLILILTTEARYWQQWSQSGTPRPLPDAIADAQASAKQTEQAIAKVQEIAPKADDKH
jgi:hypothetical protein